MMIGLMERQTWPSLAAVGVDCMASDPSELITFHHLTTYYNAQFYVQRTTNSEDRSRNSYSEIRGYPEIYPTRQCSSTFSVKCTPLQQF